MISPTVPNVDPAGMWQSSARWESDGSKLVFKAESEAIVDSCRRNPTAFLVTPLLMQGGHHFFIDDRLVKSSADPDFSRPSMTYNTEAISCAQIAEGKKVRWEAFTAT